jgi:hypothetical protein
MNLLPLTLTADAAGWTQAAAAEKGASGEAGFAGGNTVPNDPCAFCGVRSGEWRQTCAADTSEHDKPSRQLPACPLCALARHLERPRIDEEATLIWCPEMSQAAINVTLREIHRRLRLHGDGLHADDRPGRDEPERYPLHHARAALALRAGEAASRLGSPLPSDLARALLRLFPAVHARRAALLGGIRLLPLGRFFVAGEDVYSRIVDTWLGVTKPAPERERLGPMSWLPRRTGTPAAAAAQEAMLRPRF